MRWINKNDKYKKLSILLSLDFLILLLVLILIAVGTYYLSTLNISNRLALFQCNRLLSKATTLSDEEFFGLDVSNYLGTKGRLLLLNENGTLLYTSSPEICTDFSPEELDCISEYNDPSFMHITEFEQNSRNKMFLLTKEVLDKSGITHAKDYLLLDKNYRILSGTLFTNRTFLSVKEFEYLTGSDSDGYIVLKHTYTNQDGFRRILIFYLHNVLPKSSRDTSARSKQVWIFLIPVLVLIIICFIFLLAKRIRQCLVPLNAAILNFKGGGASSLQNYSGPVEFMEISRNIQELSAQLKEYEAERTRLEENRQKLLADVSHDLKNPLTAIQGYADALRDNMVPQEQLPVCLSAISKKAAHISDLLNAFHEYSKLEHPEMPLHLERLDIISLVQICLADKYEELEIAGFYLDAQVPENALFCRLDRNLFQRALENIINNSLKYNHPGTTIFLALEGCGDTVHIYIGDDGSGISPDLKDSLFDPFITSDSLRRNDQGSGLGLAITQKVILAHHGQISLTIPPRAGWQTEFHITIPTISPPPRFDCSDF